MYISPEGDFPRYIGDIMLRNPEWKEGDQLPDGWHKITESEPPQVSAEETAYVSAVEEKDGKHVLVWASRALTPEELEIKNARQNLKNKLDSLELSKEEVGMIIRGEVF